MVVLPNVARCILLEIATFGPSALVHLDQLSERISEGGDDWKWCLCNVDFCNTPDLPFPKDIGCPWPW